MPLQSIWTGDRIMAFLDGKDIGNLLSLDRLEDMVDRDRVQGFLENIGDQVEKRVGDRIWQAQELPDRPYRKTWYKLHLKGASSGDGSEYHIYIKVGTVNRLCLFFSGGGVAWDSYTAQNPVTGGRVAAGQPNFYWNNLRPFTQIMNINNGITSNSRYNPFESWNFIVVTYATGDFHIGQRDYIFRNEEHKRQTTHFHGYKNFRLAMEQAVRFFPKPRKLLIAGDSAGAFAVPALTGDIVKDYYPDCRSVTLLSDSAQLYYDGWQDTVKNLWLAEEKFWKPLRTDNITLDWYRALTEKYGNRFTCLYAGSPRDYLLSTFYNAFTRKEYATSPAVQDIYYEQMKNMVKEFREITSISGLFLYSWPQPMSAGTVHTVVRTPQFFQKNGGTSMAQWLDDAVNGLIYDVGAELL